jgi:hypothetical protein
MLLKDKPTTSVLWCPAVMSLSYTSGNPLTLSKELPPWKNEISSMLTRPKRYEGRKGNVNTDTPRGRRVHEKGKQKHESYQYVYMSYTC